MARWFAPPGGGYTPKVGPTDHGLPRKIPARVVEAPVIVQYLLHSEYNRETHWSRIQHAGRGWTVLAYGWSDGIVTWTDTRD